MATPAPLIEDRMSDEEFERRTLAAIHREFGLGGLARFISTFRSGHGDYTAERHQWLGSLTMDEILADLAKLSSKAQAPTPTR
jgi:hypothetical protein